MVDITMIMAMDYCAHYGKRLPTYKEWLFAARQNTQSVYPWGNQVIINKTPYAYRANYKSPRRSNRKRGEVDGYRYAHNVNVNTEYGLSPFKIAHMLGNVREWLSSSKHRHGWVVGGGWKTPLWKLYLTHKEHQPQYRYAADDLGFRCAKTLTNTP